MAMLKLFQNRTTKEFVICPFARDSVSNRASGPLQRIAADRFAECGAKVLNENLNEYYSRDSSLDSELYQTMSSSERRKFIAQHEMMNISLARGSNTAKVYAGDNMDFYGTLDFPFDDDSFPEYVLRAFRGEPAE